MQFIETLHVGDRVNETYFCKTKNSAITKTGKPFDALVLQDRTGTLDGKIWNPSSAGIDDFDSFTYVNVMGDVTEFNGALQLNIQRARKVDESEIDPALYMPASSQDVGEMYGKLMSLVNSIGNQWYKALLEEFFVKDEAIVSEFKKHSAAKTVHHSFIGGLLEHSLSVAQLCDDFCKNYPFLKRDLLVTAALIHDIGKLGEIEPFPQNDYSDEGNLIGHIVMGVEMVDERIAKMPDFPKTQALELKHCIVSHHGELEYGSPKKPALAEAIALSFADNLDAKMETMKEALENVQPTNLSWQKKNFFLDTIIRRTSQD